MDFGSFSEGITTPKKERKMTFGYIGVRRTSWIKRKEQKKEEEEEEEEAFIEEMDD